MTTEATAAVTDFLGRARALRAQLVELRRHIHANPELSFHERRTAAFVANKLQQMGYSIQEKVGETGVLAEIGEGKASVGIRADMDALPIEETNPNDYCSRNAGVMHACGHDAHTAAALGAASIIADLHKAEQLQGKYRFIFQPAEESVNENGLSGASLMMKDGCLEDMKALIGIHVHPGMPTGTFGFREGTFLAACDSFDITVKGKGGHGAHPEDTVDAVILACNLVQSLQTVISRRKSALSPAVLTIGGIKSNTYRSNIIAEEVSLTGTIRYFDPQLSQFFQSEIIRAGKALELFGGQMTLAYRHENPALVNNSDANAIVRRAAVEMIGAERVIELPLELGSEDFSFYTREIPSVFAIVGCAIEGSPREIHTASFDIDEDALVYACALLASGAVSLASTN